MNIVHLATSLNDGAGIAASRQIAALRAAGIACSVVTAADVPPTRFSRRLPARLLRRLFPGRRERARRRLAALGPGDYELFSLPFSDCSPETHPVVRQADILHLHWTAGLIDYPRFFTRVRQPIVWTLHDQHPGLGGFHYETDRDANPGLRALDGDCLAVKRRALAPHRLVVVGNSEWTTARARTSDVFPPATRFETIYYPLDVEAYSLRDPAAARAALGLPPAAFIVGFASTALDNRRKGFADLLAALRAIPAAVSSEPGAIHLLSFGRTPDPAHRAACPHPWHHLGFLDGDQVKTAAYAAMDVFVAPSRAEAFGQTAIEALACGVAVLATAVGGLVEAVDHGRCGVLAPPADPAALREALTALRADPARRRALAAAGRAHVASRHAPARVAAAHLALFSDLANDAAVLP